MPPVRKRVLENKKSELNPVVKEVKTAITATHHENIPIERVIYVNDSVNVQHVPGTNRYVIPFPETWRTTNGNHILGVRSIQLKHGYKRTFGFKMNFKYYDYVKNNIVEKITKEPFVFEINYSNETPNIEEWITELNKLWSTYVKMFNFEFEGENRVKLDNYTWKYTFSENNYKIELVLVDPVWEGTINYNPICYELNYVSPDLFNFDVKIENVVYKSSLKEFNSVSGILPKITIPGPLDSHSEYLLAASFVEQTSHNYLGFTNSVFSPPKYYHIVNNDTNFWIDLVSPDGLKPRELPSDGRDMLVIEIQLLSQPHTSRF